MEAAGRLDVDLVVASDRPNVMAGEFPESLLTLPFDDPVAAAEMREHAARHRLDAVVPVDDLTAVAGAAIAAALGLRANPVAAVAACGSSGGAACGAGGVMTWERGRGEGARGRGGR